MFLALSKLTRFPVFYGDLQWTQDITNKPCLLKDMKMLPGVTFLNLAVISNGHAFGASVFHVLRLCSGTRKLTLHTSGGNSLEVKLYVVYIYAFAFLGIGCMLILLLQCSYVTIWLIYVQ